MNGTRPHADPSGDTLPQVTKCACGTSSPEGASTCAGCGGSLRNSKLREPGTILGSYRLIEVLGEGGMGVVYLAEHTRLGRRVAIKMLRSEYTDNRQAVHRFFSEARAVNKICHQNIVEITDFVENAGGDNYYIMELLQGTSLAKLLDTWGAPTLARSVGIMTQIASALETVHGAGIIHRDLKPDNVFLIDRAGQKDFVKLLDFGVAKLGQATEVIGVHTTAAGTILGTPEYMSPEQASGKAVDFRTDIYAFGVMLYELVTGTLPVTGGSFGEILVKHLTVAPKPPSKIPNLPHVIPASLEDVILACLAKEPEDRPDSIQAVSDRLEMIAEAEGWVLVTFAPRTGRASTEIPVLVPMQRRKSSPSPSVDEQPVPATLEVAAAKPKSRVVPLAIALGISTVALAAYTVFRGSDPAETAPVAPATIEIVFESTPPGANVFRRGETVSLGKTPVKLTFPQADRIEAFELRLPDHEVAPHSVRLDRSNNIVTSLTPKLAPPVIEKPEPPRVPVEEPKPTKPAVKIARPPDRKITKPDRKPPPVTSGSAAPNPGDRSGVLNPFENKKKK